MIFFIFGLFLGSLLNNIALRLEKNENYFFSRSKCPSCNKVLQWFELIPLLSFFIQKGRCRSCFQKISWRYPLVEFFTGWWVFLLAISLKIDFNFFSLLEFFFYLIFLSIFFTLALYDLKTFLIDDKLLIMGIFSGLLFWCLKVYFKILPRDFSYLFNYFFVQTGKFEPLFSAFLGSSFFLIIFLITLAKGLGFGDVKVAFLMGLFLRPGDLILAIIISSFFGSLYGIYLLLKKKKLKQPIPFVPFLFLGTLLTIFWGNSLSHFYFSIFNF